jgi:hypothetical protein
MSLLELVRQYTLREYAAVTAFAMLGALGLVFMLSSASGGTASSESVLLKRQTAQSAPRTSPRYVEAELSIQERRAARLARQRQIRAARNARAAHRAAALAATRARSEPKTPTRTTTVSPTQQAVVPETTRVVNTTPTPRPVQKPAPAPTPKPTPKKSGTTGGGGGSFDDSG